MHVTSEVDCIINAFGIMMRIGHRWIRAEVFTRGRLRAGHQMMRNKTNENNHVSDGQTMSKNDHVYTLITTVEQINVTSSHKITGTHRKVKKSFGKRKVLAKPVAK